MILSAQNFASLSSLCLGWELFLLAVPAGYTFVQVTLLLAKHMLAYT